MNKFLNKNNQLIFDKVWDFWHWFFHLTKSLWNQRRANMRSSLEEGRLPRQREKEWLSLLREEGIHFSIRFHALCGHASTFRGAFSQCPPSFWIRKHLHCSLRLGTEVDRWYSPRTSQRSRNWRRGTERLPTEGEDNSSRPLKKWNKRQILWHCLWKKASHQICHT